MPAASPSTAPSRRENPAGDLWGGFAAMLVVLPSSIAYGVAVYALLGTDYIGLGVRAGLLGAIALGLVAAALGGAPRLISTPSAPAAAVLAALVTGLVAGHSGAGNPVTPERILVLLTLVALLSGCLQFLYGLVGGGRLIKYIPYPVVSGYLSGVGVLIFLSQVPKFFGWPKGVALGAGLVSPHLWQWPALVVGAVTAAGMVLAPKITRKVPATILGLGAGVLAYFGLGLIRPELLQLGHNPLVLGPVGGGARAIVAAVADHWATFAAVRFSDLGALVMPALTLSVLLSIDTLKSCVVMDALTRSRHNSNRELLAQGAGNLASALLGGMPGSGMMGATLVNVNSGGRTRLSGVLEGAFVLTAFLLFGRWIAWVPIASLAGILFVVAFRMFDWGSFQLLRQKSTMLDFGVIAAVVVVAVGFNLIAAAGTGLGLAILLFIREQIRGSVIRRKVTGDHRSSTQRRLADEQAALQQHGALATICELQGSLFFGTTDRLFTELEPDLKRCRYLILDMRRVQSVDYTAAHLLEQFEAILKERGGYLIFSRLPASLPTGQDLRAYFAQVGVTHGKENVRKFDTLDDALQWVEDQILAEVLPRPAGAEAPLELMQFELLRDFETEHTHVPFAPLAACIVARSCAPGELIFQRGDAGDELYLIRRGTVRLFLPVSDGNYHNLASCGSGDFFGEVAFLDRGQRTATAVATTAVDLFVISRARFDQVARALPVVGVKMFARLARAQALRLRHADAELRALYEA
jgi:SulP family sulfate permease